MDHARYQRWADKYPATVVGTGTLMAARALGVLTGTMLGGTPMAMALVAARAIIRYKKKAEATTKEKSTNALNCNCNECKVCWSQSNAK